MSYNTKFTPRIVGPTTRPREDDTAAAAVPANEAQRHASFFTSYACKSEHQFLNDKDGNRDANTRCAGCLRTIGELFDLKCTGNTGSNNHERMNDLITEKIKMQTRIKDLEDRLTEQMIWNAEGDKELSLIHI